MRFSVIVPVYNVEKYIGKCLDSIIRQSYDDFELIIIYDKSDDNTFSIISNFAKDDNRIKIVENEVKGGVSFARNLGISLAKGEYIVCVDSDDYIATDSLKVLSEAIDKHGCPDWIYGNGNFEFSDNESETELKNYVKELEPFNGCSGLEMLGEFTKHKGAIWSVWGKAYKRSFWNSLDCISKSPFREDLEMGYKILERADKVATVPAFYFYRRGRVGSLMNTFSVRQESTICDILANWLAYLQKNNGMSEELKADIKRRFNDEVCCSVLPRIYFAKGEDRKILLLKAETIKEYLKYPFNGVNALVALSVRTVGLKVTCRILSRLKHIKYSN